MGQLGAGTNKSLCCASAPEKKTKQKTFVHHSHTDKQDCHHESPRLVLSTRLFAYSQDWEIVDLIALSVARKEHAIICNLLNLQMPVQSMQLRIVPFCRKDGVIKCGVCLCSSVCAGRNGFVKLHVAGLYIYLFIPLFFGRHKLAAPRNCFKELACGCG